LRIELLESRELLARIVDAAELEVGLAQIFPGRRVVALQTEAALVRSQRAVVVLELARGIADEVPCFVVGRVDLGGALAALEGAAELLLGIPGLSRGEVLAGFLDVLVRVAVPLLGLLAQGRRVLLLRSAAAARRGGRAGRIVFLAAERGVGGGGKRLSEDGYGDWRKELHGRGTSQVMECETGRRHFDA
jgi:hypothetical protein